MELFEKELVGKYGIVLNSSEEDKVLVSFEGMADPVSVDYEVLTKC